MRETVQKWLESGAEVQAGLRLLSLFTRNKHLDRLVTLRPDKYKILLVNVLCRISGAFFSKKPTSLTLPTTRPAFREQWPFLAAPNCPPELKVLAADKITSYHTYVASHCQLFDCATLEDCFAVAETLIKSFIENRKIFYEFAYYDEHHILLGRHPIFKEMQEMASLRKMGIVALIARKKNIEDAIWRIKHELERGTKPHLDIDRKQRLSSKEVLLNQVNKLIDEYQNGR